MKVAVVIPCYKVKDHIVEVIAKIGNEVNKIYVIDDCCPENSGEYAKENITDSRVTIHKHTQNKGVGGAVKTGYQLAYDDGCDIVVKLDGDGQMDPKLIPGLIHKIQNGKADYVKGNRFYNLATLAKMPGLRLFGNSVLSLINKFVSGYWDVIDPTNGFTAIHRNSIKLLPLDKISDRYFFESDMLFRLGTIRAVVKDYSMDAFYGDENSSLSIVKVTLEFPFKYANRFFKRIFYQYFLREINIATFQMLLGSPLFLFGIITGIMNWKESVELQLPATSGTVMLSALPIILGFIMILNALQFDIQNIPKEPLQDEKMD